MSFGHDYYYDCNDYLTPRKTNDEANRKKIQDYDKNLTPNKQPHLHQELSHCDLNSFESNFGGYDY